MMHESDQGRLINIDNGGTLTDFCVIDGDRIYRTKSITTPYDLSKCFFDGLRKLSRQIYGSEDLQSLLLSAAHIRYSTTQGTNALVERKGPRLGLLLGGDLGEESIRAAAGSDSLFEALVGKRVAHLGKLNGADNAEQLAVTAVSNLLSAGANRIVVSLAGDDSRDREAAMKRLLLRKFPPHFLGAIPLLFSFELAEDDNDERRTWTALFNAFLHPAMERFLYSAEQKLRDLKTRNPLLIFRNDGQSGRVVRTTAIKTYSSGPRGGLEGARALAAHYAFPRLLTMDIGGTTTDIGLVENGSVSTQRYGVVEDVHTSFPLCDIVSSGIGGSSIIKANGSGLQVGPESMGGQPGPACFGLGGQEATITDAFLVLGLLDPEAYFGGELRIDPERARAAVLANVGNPSSLDEVQAAVAMEDAWVAKVVRSLQKVAGTTEGTTLAAFGGAGPLVVCKVAEAAGISRVVIPGMAAVFSAFGIGFSDIGHRFEAVLPALDEESLQNALAVLIEQARRSMFSEGFELEDCTLRQQLQLESDSGEQLVPLDDGRLPPGLEHDGRVLVSVEAVMPIPHSTLSGEFGASAADAVSQSARRLFAGGEWVEVPVYRISEQPAGNIAGSGPAVLEEDFFSCRVDPGWQFEINEARDVLLTHTGHGAD